MKVAYEITLEDRFRVDIEIDVPDEKIAECKNAGEAMALISSAVETDYRRRIGWTYVGFEPLVQRAARLIAERATS